MTTSKAETAKADLFEDKAGDWDGRDLVRQLSAGIGQAMLAHTPLRDDMEVMDFGAGTGLISSHLAPRVRSITAVDISSAMLTKLQEKPELQGKVVPVCQDILDKPLARTFDLIVSAMAMHHVEDTERLVATLAAHLKPGARIALADLDTEDGTFHAAGIEGVFHAGFAREALRDALARHGFTDIRFVTAHTARKEGKEYPIFLVTAVKR